MINKKIKRQRRHKRVRGKIIGTVKIPRLCVFRSNKHIYAQLIDDREGKTLISASDLDIPAASAKRKQAGPPKSEGFGGKAVIAYQVGEIIAQRAIDKKIKKIIFDRGGYKYHGRVKAVADGAREGGLEF